MNTSTTSPIANNSLNQAAEELVVLIDGCKNGDRKAQKLLYDRYAPTHYAKIRRYVTEINDANAILNDSFFKIFTHITNFTTLGSFEGWMHRVTINTILDFLRKQKKYQNTSSLPDNDLIEVAVPENTLGKLAYKELLALVHELPDIQRSVFNLFVFDDCSHKEIAALIGITENNSRWHLNDARRRLKLKMNALK